MSGRNETVAMRASVPFRTLAHFYDADDPSPEDRRELSDRAEDQIFREVLEVSKGYRKDQRNELEIIFPSADLTSVQPAAITSAIRSHFLLRAKKIRRNARLIERVGLREFRLTVAVCIPSFIGIAVCSQFKGNPLAEVFEQVLVIFCWVTIWQPFQSLVFDRWTQSKKAYAYERIAEMEIRVRPE